VLVRVVSHQARLRWIAVLCGIAIVCAVPVVIGALPVSGSSINAATLRSAILRSANVPYQGYAESTVNMGLPVLPYVGDVSTLLDGTTDQYAWYRSPRQWRADTLTSTGENDTYQSGSVAYIWNYADNLLSQVTGAPAVRLPRAADLLPPALARRVLAASSAGDHLTRLPSRKIAGVDAAGLRLVPADRSTTVGAIQIWADPASGLPVEVQVIGRGSARPVLVSSFLDLSQHRPALTNLIPRPAPDVGFSTTRLPDVNGILKGDGDGDHDGEPFPAGLASRSEVAVPGAMRGVAGYGSGFSRFFVLPLPSGVGSSAVTSAETAGAAKLTLPGGTGALIRTPLLTVVLLTPRTHHSTFLLTGAVSPALLEKAAAGLISYLATIR
jgi:hypothetical protein